LQLQSPAASPPQRLGVLDLLLNLSRGHDQQASPAGSSALPPDGDLSGDLDEELLDDLQETLADVSELERPINLQPAAALPPLLPVGSEEDASHRVPTNLEAQAFGYEPLEDETELDTDGKWRGKRPRGDHWQRATMCKWFDPKSVNKYFPPFKDKERYGQRQVPQDLINQYSNVRHKVGAVMNWRRMSPNQQKQFYVQLTTSAKEERRLDQYIQKIEDSEANEEAKWQLELRAAVQWQQEMDEARAKYESADPVDTNAILSALHRINSLMEESILAALRAENVALNKLSVQERKARTAAKAAAKAAESRDEEDETQEVSDAVSLLFCNHISFLLWYYV